MYVTWFLWIFPVVGLMTTVLFVSCSLGLWYCFLKSWLGDPGIISASNEEKFRVSENLIFILKM